MGQRKILSPHEDFLSSQWILKVICINFGQFWSILVDDTKNA